MYGCKHIRHGHWCPHGCTRSYTVCHQYARGRCEWASHPWCDRGYHLISDPPPPRDPPPPQVDPTTAALRELAPRGFLERHNGFDYLVGLHRDSHSGRQPHFRSGEGGTPPAPATEDAGEPGPEPEPPLLAPHCIFCQAGCGLLANSRAGYDTCCGVCPGWHTTECGQRQAELPAAAAETVFPRHAPRDAAQLPRAIRRLADQLPAGPGRLGTASRILRAVQMGASDRAVARGDSTAREVPGQLGLLAQVYVVLVDQYGRGPWICRDRGDYEEAVGSPCAPAAVSGIFASDAEAIAYLWGSGVPAVLPPTWPEAPWCLV